MKISRKAESEIPDFDSHKEALRYFKNKYGDNFVTADSEIIGDETVHFYHLVLDMQKYLDGFKRLEADGFLMDSLGFMNSYQPVEIFEDGRIHIIH